MNARRARLRDSRSWPFDVGLLVVATGVLGSVVYRDRGSLLSSPTHLLLALVIGVPVVVLLSRFPLTLRQRGRRGIEVGFEPSALILLLCVLNLPEAATVWVLAVVTTELLSRKTPTAIACNVGIASLGGAAAGLTVHAVRGPADGSARELLAVVLGAAAYFAIDYLLTVVSMSLEAATSVFAGLRQRGTLLALSSSVAITLMGFLAALVLRYAPWWPVTFTLLIPLAALIMAARAVNRGQEKGRRLAVLLRAAVEAQTLLEHGQVVDALRVGASHLLRPAAVTLRSTPPGDGEVGSRVTGSEGTVWVVSAARVRPEDATADQEALDALAAIASDALGRLQLTEDMVHFARHDPLTDLPNRGILQDRTTHALQLAQRRGSTGLALLMLDLDGFKPVNDRFGHPAGDRVLVEVGGRLRRCVRSSDTVARLGGDEFAVLLEDADRGRAVVLAQQMLTAISEGISINGTLVPLGASVGIAFSDADSTTERMLRNADLAMYEAKARGKGRVVEYQAAMGATSLERLELIAALREAVAQRRIDVAYQPVIHATSGRIEGVEALARWRLDGVDVAPDQFIALAEDIGLIVSLGEAVLEQAAAHAVALRDVVGRPIPMSVNISVQQLRDDRFIDVVRRTVAAMDGIQLVLEITEREGIGGDSRVHDAMAEIHGLGVLFAIDDFGVGFSSISYLRGVPAHILKADRALSRDIDTDERACVLLRSIATMGREMGMEVVVEGIERESQLALVRDDVQADFAQGFLMHRPMAFAQLVEVVSSEDATPAPAAARPAPVVVATEEPALTVATSG